MLKNKKKRKQLSIFWKDRLINIGFTLIVVFLIFIVWLIAFKCYPNRLIIPSISETFQAMGQQLGSSVFWVDIGFTLLRSFIAFIVSISLAILVVILGKVWWPVRKFFDPIAAILRTLPTMAIILLIMVWTPNYIAPVIVAFGVVFPNCYSQIKAAVDNIDPNLITMAKVFNLKKKDIFHKIYFNQSLPYLLRCIGNDFSFSFKVMISAECMAGTAKSLGDLITTAKAADKIARLTALIIIGVVFAIIIDLSLSQLVRITNKWNRKNS